MKVKVATKKKWRKEHAIKNVNIPSPHANVFSSGKDEHCGANAGNNSNESLKVKSKERKQK